MNEEKVYQEVVEEIKSQVPFLVSMASTVPLPDLLEAAMLTGAAALAGNLNLKSHKPLSIIPF